MTQSALSEQILQFERECGSVLFNRRHSGVTLTPAGEYLLPQAESLLAKASETRDGLAGFRHGYQERLRVGSVLGPLQSWLPATLAQFAQTEPQVQLQVHHAYSVNDILGKVAASDLDVGVVSLRPGAPARSRHDVLTQVVLMDEELVVLIPDGHSLAQQAHVSQAELCGSHLVAWPAGYNLRLIIDDWFKRGGCSPLVAAESGAMEVILSLVLAGVGVCILPRSLSFLGAVPGLKRVRLTPDDRPRRLIAAVYRRQEDSLGPVRAIVRLMKVHSRDAGRQATLAGAGVGRNDLGDGG
jgi:DNA-binding transcriptional LysR family regulator